MIRLLALDLDDTLLSHDLSISLRNYEAVQKARQHGVEIILATARGWFGTRSFYQQLGLNSLAVCGSGTRIYNQQENCIKSWTIPLDIAREILDIAEQNHIMMICSLPDKNLFNRVTPEWEAKIRPGIDFLVPHLATQLTNPPAQLFVKGEREVSILQQKLAHSYPEVAAHILLYPDGVPEMMIIHPEVNKATGIAWVCEQAGISPSEVMTIGDSTNDLSMISWAGMGIAMGWASEQLKAAADFIIDPDDPDGVAAAIHRFILA